MRLDGQRIVVTGAGRGIGRAIALACAREGAVVGVNACRSREEAEAVAREAGGRLLLFDVADAAAAAAAIDRFAAEEGRLDALVNNAAVPVPGLLVSLPPEEAARAAAVNLLGPVHCARAALPHLLARRSGVILNVGSSAAVRPHRGQAVYAATKGAMEAFTRALAVEYGRKGIRAVCLRPGPVETRLTEGARALAGEEVTARIPLGRFAAPEEVADLAVWLLSPAASFASGAVYPLDGGFEVGA